MMSEDKPVPEWSKIRSRRERVQTSRHAVKEIIDISLEISSRKVFDAQPRCQACPTKTLLAASLEARRKTSQSKEKPF